MLCIKQFDAVYDTPTALKAILQWVSNILFSIFHLSYFMLRNAYEWDYGISSNKFSGSMVFNKIIIPQREEVIFVLTDYDALCMPFIQFPKKGS